MKTTLNYIEYTLPSHYASYLVNGDCSGLSDEDTKEIDSWIESELKENKEMSCFDVSEESDFLASNDLNNLGGDCSVFSFDVGNWNYATEKDLNIEFQEIAESIPQDDEVMKNEAFHNWKDGLHQDGQISDNLVQEADLIN